MTKIVDRGEIVEAKELKRGDTVFRADTSDNWQYNILSVKDYAESEYVVFRVWEIAIGGAEIGAGAELTDLTLNPEERVTKLN